MNTNANRHLSNFQHLQTIITQPNTTRNRNEYQQQITPLSPSIHPRYMNDDGHTINQFQLPKSLSLPPDDLNFSEFQHNFSCMFLSLHLTLTGSVITQFMNSFIYT